MLLCETVSRKCNVQVGELIIVTSDEFQITEEEEFDLLCQSVEQPSFIAKTKPSENQEELLIVQDVLRPAGGEIIIQQNVQVSYPYFINFALF